MALSCLFAQAENLEVFEDVDGSIEGIEGIPMEEIGEKVN